MPAKTPPQDRRPSSPPASTSRSTRGARRPLTAIGRARGPHRAFLIATCLALVLAAIGDEATGYDGPGPFIDIALAVVVALVPWRFTPLFVTAMSVLFLYGGLADPDSAHRLIEPGRVLDFTAGWVQMLGFAAAAVVAVASVAVARRQTTGRHPDA